MTPNRERIKLWVDALRSGKFTQGRGRLYRRETYCCLGVACELAVQAGVPVERKVLIDWDMVDGVNETDTGAGEAVLGDIAFDDHVLDMPPSVATWLGLRATATDPEVLIGEGDEQIFVGLITLNDTYEWDFNQIADAIEATWLPENTWPHGKEEGTDEDADISGSPS